MKASVYVIAGILDTGKTTWINDWLSSRDKEEGPELVVQFEEGDEKIKVRHQNCKVVGIPQHKFLKNTTYWKKYLYEYIYKNKINTVYIEWNGIAPFEQLEDLLLSGELHEICEIKQVLYLIQKEKVLQVISGMGKGPVSQLTRADVICYGGEKDRRAEKLLHQINPSAEIYHNSVGTEKRKNILEEGQSPYSRIMFFSVMLLVLGLLFPIFLSADRRISQMVGIFIGLLLQGIPFLLIGVLVSSFIQVFISKETILKWFPKKRGVGLLGAIVAGFCLPVCDCASIPIFKSLIRKGVPLYAAITFMFAAPVINPVVMLSTFYAFNGDITVVIKRVVFGIIVAASIGGITSILTKKETIVKENYCNLGCTCGCNFEVEKETSIGKKMELFLCHSQLEFLDVGRYLVLGTFLSAVFQCILAGNVLCVCDWPFGLRLGAMMGISFALSLCSSADAVVAKGFVGEFSLAAVMGFLVFGPMLDIKNILMLQSGFSKRFIVKLCMIAVVTCFSILFAVGILGIGGW